MAKRRKQAIPAPPPAPAEPPHAKAGRIANLAADAAKANGATNVIVIIAVPDSAGEDCYHATWRGRALEARGLLVYGNELIANALGLKR